MVLSGFSTYSLNWINWMFTSSYAGMVVEACKYKRYLFYIWKEQNKAMNFYEIDIPLSLKEADLHMKRRQLFFSIKHLLSPRQYVR